MELELWLMRHGEAAGADTSGTDHGRPLTEHGQQQVQQFARWLAGRVPAPDIVWHSPLRRARETAELMAAEFTLAVSEQPVLSPGMRADRLLEALAARTVTRAVCVGHQPDIGGALRDMIGGGRLLVPPGTCAAVVFTGPIVAGAGSLRWLADPAWFGG
ncbi:MAG TPA: histidine phosphatase family protein [Planctomycetaceae bacterium]|nr:histidine phosphatase family protein [Planctomycetaceae bacterium]